MKIADEQKRQEVLAAKADVRKELEAHNRRLKAEEAEMENQLRDLEVSAKKDAEEKARRKKAEDRELARAEQERRLVEETEKKRAQIAELVKSREESMREIAQARDTNRRLMAENMAKVQADKEKLQVCV